MRTLNYIIPTKIAAATLALICTLVLTINKVLPSFEQNLGGTHKDMTLFDLGKMSKFPTSYTEWDKYIDLSSTDLSFPQKTVGKSKDLIYVYQNSKTQDRISFSAYENYPDESLVNALAKALIEKPKNLYPNKYYFIAGGSTIRDNWAFYTFTSINYSNNFDTEDEYDPISIIAYKNTDGQWTAILQGTHEYIDVLNLIPDTIMSSGSKQDQTLLSQKLYEKYY